MERQRNGTTGGGASAMAQLLAKAKEDTENKKKNNETQGAQPIKKEGWMEKRGHKRKNWTKRWFVLKKQSIEYYKTLGGKMNPRGVIMLDGAKVSKDVGEKNSRELRNDRKEENCFLIQTREGIDYLCRANNEEDLDDWVQAVRIRIMDIEGKIKKPPLRGLSSLLEECSAGNNHPIA